MKLLESLPYTNAAEAAKQLLGHVLVREINDTRLAGKIVETEAYHQNDAAAHSYRGQTARNAVMFGPAGFAYVYFTYGMHYCFNVVCGPVGRAEAVLIRALEPLEGIDVMRLHRSTDAGSNLCSGPAKLCQAFAIDKTLNGHDVSRPPLWLETGEAVPESRITVTTRIGITKAVDEPLRFYVTDNPFVSKK